MNLTFIQKTKVMAGVFVAVLVLNAVLTLSSLSSIRDNADELSHRQMKLVNLAHETKLAVVQVQQWMTDISATRALDGLNDGLDVAKENADLFYHHIEQLKTLDPAHAKDYDNMLPVFKNYYAAGEKMAHAYIDSGPKGGNSQMSSFDAAAEAMGNKIDEFLQRIIDNANASGESQHQQVSSMQTYATLATIIMVGVLIAAFLLGRSLITFLGNDPEELKKIVDNISEGKLDQSHSGQSHGVYHSVLSMQDKLSSIIEKDIQKIIDAANHGNLNERIDLHSKQGFYHHLCSSFNNLVDTNQHVVDDLSRVFKALETGDLNSTIQRQYEGQFKELKDSANSTCEKIKCIIEGDIQIIIDSISKGDLSQRISLDDKQGFFKELSTGINSLVNSTESFFNDMSHSIQQIEKGDLTQPINTHYAGQFEELKNSINSTIQQLNTVVLDIDETSETVKTASDEILSGNNNLSDRTENQASALEETAASAEELSSTVENNTATTAEANQLATDTKETVEKSTELMNQVSSAMQDINNSSDKIAEIIGVIDEIAFQTNLLALNASVEAARAGEQGRGFAVVATEVRNLAGRSATAAKEIKELIIDSSHKVKTGVELVNQSTESQNQVVEGISSVGQLIESIALSSQEQTSGIHQVNQAIASMEQSTQQNAALAEETSAAARILAERSNQLHNALDFFKT